MNNSPLQKGLEWVYQNFKKNTAKMLVITGTVGWGLSSLAQVGAILFNPQIKKEQKGFLIPQAIWDAAVNIGTFFLITQSAKKIISKLASCGKIAPDKVRNFLNKNKDLYGDKAGKVSFDLDEVIKQNPKFPKESYYSYKNYVTTMGTIGASILASNIVTPVIRNSIASDVQKKYLKNRPPQVSGNMKI